MVSHYPDAMYKPKYKKAFTDDLLKKAGLKLGVEVGGKVFFKLTASKAAIAKAHG